jgi:hypothetical protein
LAAGQKITNNQPFYDFYYFFILFENVIIYILLLVSSALDTVVKFRRKSTQNEISASEKAGERQKSQFNSI